jgi:Predicted nucleotide-binding protein containing TIR-like domain
MTILVTLGGECFEADYEATGNADGRDGVLYYFKIRDLREDRGTRSVSMFRSGTDKVSIKDYDLRVETVRLNVLRRAFDSGIFSFETPVTPHRYHELRLRAADFQPQKKASDEAIRHFIKLGAFYLGFKYPPNNASIVDFDCAEDLEYLGANAQDIGRNVRLLTEEGYLRISSAATLSNPWRVSPTAKLIREVEGGKDDHNFALPERIRPAPITSRKIFLVHGHADEVKQTVSAFLKTLSLDVVILHEQPNQGRTIIEKFEKHSDVGFAVVLLTPDDIGAPVGDATKTRHRARQNVILELGYFIGKLGRGRVCSIYVSGVELPSDLHGVLWVAYDRDGKWQSQLAKEINAAGIEVITP